VDVAIIAEPTSLVPVGPTTDRPLHGSGQGSGRPHEPGPLGVNAVGAAATLVARIERDVVRSWRPIPIR
jgi:hypothetical protein